MLIEAKYVIGPTVLTFKVDGGNVIVARTGKMKIGDTASLSFGPVALKATAKVVTEIMNEFGVDGGSRVRADFIKLIAMARAAIS